jgi:hypothetical protein
MSGAAQPTLQDIAAQFAALSAQVQQLANEQVQLRALDARTGQLEQFVEGLKPDAPDPVVRVRALHEQVQVLEADWQAGDERVRDELQQAQAVLQSRVERVETAFQPNSEWNNDVLAAVQATAQQEVRELQAGLEGRVLQQLQDRNAEAMREMEQAQRRNSLYTDANARVDELTTRVNALERERVGRDIDNANNGGASPGHGRDGASHGHGRGGASTGLGRGGLRASIGMRDGGAQESDNGGGATPMRRSRPSVFLPDAVPMPTPPVAQDAAVSSLQPTYYLTASQVLDARFADEDCPESLAEGDPDAPRDPKYEKDLPDESLWHGKRTMIPREDAKSQGFYDALRKLQQHFKREHIVTSRRRLTALEKMIVPDAERSHFLDMVKVREHAMNRRLTYEEARRLGLDLFSPSDWLAQALSVWRRTLDQGSKPGSKWLASMLQARAMCNNMIPGDEPAFSDAFFALLLRAGVSNAIETELARTDYAVYDATAALATINEVSRRLPNDGAGSQASVNRAQGFTELDAEAVAAVKMVKEMAEVHRTAVVYSGALAELLRSRGISEQEFQRRKQEKECVYCTSKDHFLFSCPEYMSNGLDKSRAQGRQQGKAEYKQDLQRRVLSRADAHRHFRRTGEVAGAHAGGQAQANMVSAGGEAVAKVERGRTMDRSRFAPVTDTRSLSRGLSASSASSLGSDAYALLSEDEEGAENGSGEGR